MASTASVAAPGKIHVLLYQDLGGERPWWIAHCLDFDIVAPAPDPRGALAELGRMLRVQADTARDLGIEPYSTCPRANNALWERWGNGVNVSAPAAMQVGTDVEARVA